MSLTTFKPPIQFPLFTHQPPLHHHIHHHRPTTTTIIRFSRWNNANAKKHIQKHQQTQHDIETHLRFDKRFQTAHNIITKAPPPPPQTTVTPPSPPSPEFKSAGTPSVPSQPSIPGKKSKYSKGVDPRKANFEDDDLGSGEPSWGTAVTPPLSYGGFSNDPDAQNARKVDFGKVNPRNPSFGNDELGSGEGLYSSAVFPPLLSGGFSKDPDAQNDRKLDFGKVNPRNPSFGNGDLGSGERFYSTAGAPPLSSGRWSKNPDAQKANFKYPNPRKPSFEKYDSFSGEQSWGTAGGLPLSSDRFPKNPDGQNARKANFKYPNPRNPSFGNNDLGSGEPLGGTTISQPLSSGRFPKNPYAQKPRNANFGKYGSGQKSKETKFGNSNSGNANYQHPAFKRIVKMRQIESEIDEDTCVKVDEKGLSYVIPEAPFEFQYSYTETPKVKPIKLREAAIAPFGPGTIPRPWTGRKPLAPSKKKLEFDSFVLPPPHKKGVKPVQAPGPFLAGSGPKYVRERDEVLGEALSKEEVDDLIKGCLKSDRQLNMGRDGLTHNMLDNIHAHWKRRRVCKIKCKGVCTVDMDNVRQQLEEKTGGKIIYSKGGVVYLFRGRNYNYKTRPVFPLMLWKPITPVYPRLIQRAPDGLTIEEASEMRHRGRQLIPICKLGKNGVYSDLAKNVREAFEACELVRINCEGMNGSDYRKIGAKLKDLVPCVLISFEQEHILMWRGRDWKSMFTQENEHQEANNDPDTESIDSLVASLESSPEDLTADEYEENEDENTTHTESIDSLVASIESSAEDLTEDEIEENEDEKITRENFDDNENMTPHDSEDDISETTSKHDCLEGVMSLLNQAVQDGIAVVLEDPSLDADVVYAMAVAFSKSALPGPAFRHLRPDKVAMDITERQEHGETVGKEAVRASERKKGNKTKTSPRTRKKENYLDVVPQATLRVDELAKLLG